MHTSIATHFIAFYAYSIRGKCQKHLKNTASSLLWRLSTLAVSGMLLASCASPPLPASKVVYDFGPVMSVLAVSEPMRKVTVALPEFDASGSLDSPALLYRLQYADAQQLRPYAQARWSVPPAQLVRTRLRDALSAKGPVVGHEGGAAFVLRVELDEFSQVFESTEKSLGVIRLRASLMRNDQLAAQTVVLARAPAPSPDAAGGVRALTAASDDAVGQLLVWLTPLLR
jgi:cholesterol transport system auxiliary component